MIEVDLTKLNEYLASKVVASGLVGYAVLTNRDKSDIAVGGTYVEVTISNMHRSPPLNKIYSVTVARFIRDGVHLFDGHIDESITDLTRTS
ncbi:MAG TPA: hypothetical protein VGI93_20350 [Steroidobacteraceae bacterium]